MGQTVGFPHMALSADQRALLELLLHKGQSYDDIASLLDISEAEVRSRARWALAALGDADPDRNVALTDWLLGQADPIGRADAARRVREDPEDHRLAAKLIAALRELAPDADLPKLPADPGGGGFLRRGTPEAPIAPKAPAAESAPEASATAAPGPKRLSSLTPRQTRMIVGLGSAAVILIAVVLAITGAFGGDDEGTPEAQSTTTDPQAAVPDGDAATIPLKPVGGGDARGAMTVGVAGQDEPFLDVTAENLQAAPSDSTYFIWFMQDERSGYPYQPLDVDNSGAVSERFSLPSEFLGVALSSVSADIWISPLSELEKQIPDAVSKGAVVEIPGERVLTAPISRIAEAAGVGSGNETG
jgi:hypothetical protein